MLTLRRLAQGLAFACVLGILPVIGNRMVLTSTKWWLVLAACIASVALQPATHLFKRAPRSDDHGTMLQIFWSTYLSLLATALETAYLRAPQALVWHPWSSLPLLGMVLGLVIRTWSVRTLGASFTMQVQVNREQVIIGSGPYRYVRHPSYLGALLLFLSVPALLGAWFSLFLTSALLFFAFARRIYWEERALARVKGDEYLAYAARTRRLVPFLW